MEPPPSPSTSPNSNPNPNPNPITFIQADARSFKQVVQLLTGNSPSQNHAPPPKNPNPNPIKKPAFKLYERRSSSKNLKMISPLLPSSAAAAGSLPGILSPSILDFPKLALSPVTPLSPDRLSPVSPEDRAIAEKGFYLHPSPRDAEPPKLLPLFPVKSPRRMEEPSAGESRE